MKKRKSSHSVEKLSPSGRVAQGAERGLRLPELSLKVFPLGGENISFGLNWEKVARMRRKRGARRLKIRTDDINKTNIHTYFKSEETPLCRIEFQLITTSHGNGISPKLSKNLHKVRQVGTLFAVSIQKPSRKNRKSSHSADKLSPSGRVAQKRRNKKLSPLGRVAQGAERGLRLKELSLKVFTLCGENISFSTNWEKVARMRRKRGTRRL